MRRSLHLEWFLFHRHDDSLSLIKVEKPKPFRQAYYLPPPHSSNESVTGNSSGRIISKMSLSGFQSPFIKLRLCILEKKKNKKQNPTAAASSFLCLFYIFLFLLSLKYVSLLGSSLACTYKKHKLINLGTFLPLMQTGIL